MDMDQRTRTLGGGRGGRVILLGDGTEIVTGGNDDDGDVDMEDRGEAEEEEEKDLEEQVKKGQAQATTTTTTTESNGPVKERDAREQTPAPSNASQNSEPSAKAEGAKPDSSSKDNSSSESSIKTPDEPKMSVPIDVGATKEAQSEGNEQK